MWTVEDPSTLLFIDETAKSSQSEKRRSFWSPEGVSTSLAEDFTQTSDRYTLLAAVNMDGFVLEACELVQRKRSANDGNPSRGTINRERFILYLQNFVVPYVERAAANGKSIKVVWDNAPIHVNDQHIEDLITNAGGEVRRLAPYR